MSRIQRDEVHSGRYFIHLFVCLLMVGVIAAMVRALLPLISVVVPVAFGWWLWRSYRRSQRRQRERLNSIFYELIQAHQGRTTILDFAMKAQLPAGEARQFLNDRAREFSAHFEVSDRDVIYVFQTMKTYHPVSQTVIIDEVCTKTVERSSEPIPVAISSTQPLTQTQLAQRLNLSPSTIRRKKTASNFSEWSKARDPQGIAWNYSPAIQRFYPEKFKP